MKKTLLALLIAIMCFAAYGCGVSGRQVDLDKVTQLAPGETTKNEMLNMFGPPTSQSLISDGTSILTWVYTRVVVFIVADVRTQSLAATFDKNNVLVSYNTSEGHY